MDFNDTPEEAAFRAEVRAWLEANATPKRNRDDKFGAGMTQAQVRAPRGLMPMPSRIPERLIQAEAEVISKAPPVDLSGYTARMQVRRSVSAADVLLEASTSNDRIQLDPLAGRVTLVLPADVTSAINWTRGLYDIELVSPDGDVTRLVQGEITVSKEVTRD